MNDHSQSPPYPRLPAAVARSEIQTTPPHDCPAGEPIFTPDYWRGRLQNVLGTPNLHHAVFRCPADKWQRIAAKHREILRGLIKSTHTILDAGCGWGRLLDLLPPEWEGHYVGIDLSPDFIRMAGDCYLRGIYPTTSQQSLRFLCADLRDIPSLFPQKRFDWVVIVSIRPMIRRHCGAETWDRIEAGLRQVGRRLLYLEYDETDPGEVVETELE